MTGDARGPELPWPIDVAVFAPVGAAANLFDPKPAPGPDCVARGRHEVDVLLERAERALQQAHGTGRLAVAFGVPMLQRSLADRIAKVRGETPAGSVVGDVAPSAQWPEAASSPGSAAETAAAPSAEPITLGSAEELVIPGYDTLSASQVVERLDGLSGHELAQVREYEATHRNRRTILGKIDQLATEA